MTNPIESLASEPAPVKAWPAVRIAAAVSAVLWLCMALNGISGIEGIRNQHVPGYPNDGQLRLYVVIPLMGLACSAAIVCLAGCLPTFAKRVGMGVSYISLLFVFLIWGGGI